MAEAPVDWVHSSYPGYARRTARNAFVQYETLYEAWRADWPEPYDFKNGIKAITAEMILEVPEKNFKRVFGHKIANRILEAARRNAGR